MTGFGRAETDLPGSGRAAVEIRSVNHRFLEVDCRLPEGFQTFEENIRAMVGRVMARGQVRVSVALRGAKQPVTVVFQEQLARKYHHQLEGLRRRLKIPGGVSLETLLGLPQVVTVSERNGASAISLWKPVERAVFQALSGAVKMRRDEGGRLEKGLRQRIEIFERLTRKIRQRVPTAQGELQKRLAERIEAALQQAGKEIPATEVLAREAAMSVQSTDVNEEMERIASHFVALRGAVAGWPAGRGEASSSRSRWPVAAAKKGEQASPGRTLDFLAQELQREVNTLGTKLRDPAVSRWVVEFKGQIEKLREQAANVE